MTQAEQPPTGRIGRAEQREPVEQGERPKGRPGPRASQGSWIFARSVPARAAGRSPLEDPSGRLPAPPAPLSHPVFGQWLVLSAVPSESIPGSRLSLARAEDFTRAVRGALLHHAIDPAPAALSGHAPDGPRLDRPHAAFLALPDLHAPAAQSRIVGAAIALPRDIDAAAHQAILLAAARWERGGLRLLLGRLGALQLARADHPEPGSPLDPAKWTRPARRWASVTPVALPRNPGDLTARDPRVAAKATERTRQIVAHACEQVGLPRPARVRVAPRSLFPAAPPAPTFMPYPRLGSGFKRVCVHAEVEFEEEIAGPLLIGAGRYFGVGLCAPVAETP